MDRTQENEERRSQDMHDVKNVITGTPDCRKSKHSQHEGKHRAKRTNKVDESFTIQLGFSIIAELLLPRAHEDIQDLDRRVPCRPIPFIACKLPWCFYGRLVVLHDLLIGMPSLIAIDQRV